MNYLLSIKLLEDDTRVSSLKTSKLRVRCLTSYLSLSERLVSSSRYLGTNNFFTYVHAIDIRDIFLLTPYPTYLLSYHVLTTILFKYNTQGKVRLTLSVVRSLIGKQSKRSRRRTHTFLGLFHHGTNSSQ